MVYGFDRQFGILESSNTATYLFTATILTAGTQFLVWLGDQISLKGIGNGISIIIFGGIVANIPAQFVQVYNITVASATTGAEFSGILQFVLYLILYVVIILGVVVMELAVRKIPIQYSSSNSMRGKDVTYLPLKINSASVIPVIFASSIMTAPQIILSFVNSDAYTKVSSFLSLTSWTGLVIYAVLTFLFTFFYTDLQVDPDKIAENLGKSGAYIPGIRPGTETKTYLHKVLHRADSDCCAAVCAADDEFAAVLDFDRRYGYHYCCRCCSGNSCAAEGSADAEVVSRIPGLIKILEFPFVSKFIG